ncbi:Hypothetical predicted protein [Lecanosticta acicola]|uniref:Autophagy-related protein 16 domain-containing protein n=1 Tax=Lecanosticta acicola TaxID=111012 RepID=A0AAI8Z8G2_9PEZI|nr:Hypothetical predicted protein [Lecanosticta acicola]
MTDYLGQYSLALDVRDAREKAHKQYIDAYTRLADRSSASASLHPAPPSTTTPKQPTTTSTTSPTPDLLTTLRADLVNTQKSRSALQTNLTTLTQDLQTLQAAHTTTTAQLQTLTRQKTDIERRLRDREEELRQKRKFVENAQDEMVALQLQLNLSEEKRERAERENGELVERWMRRMGEEAESMNRESRWGEGEGS